MEVWKDIEGYKGIYQVSDAGRVRSVDRINSRGYKRKGIILKLQDGNRGYKTVGLCKDGVMKSHLVHRLVAVAFIPNPENKPEVNHTEGNKPDNRACKLEWCTAAENSEHAVKMRLLKPPLGERHPQSKLSEIDVLDIRWLRGFGVTIAALAGEYQVSTTSVRQVLTGRSWGHV